MQTELERIAQDMRDRYAVGDGRPSADLIAQHAVDVAHMLARWADRIAAVSAQVSPAQKGKTTHLEDALQGTSQVFTLEDTLELGIPSGVHVNRIN